ncbi:MAP kinase kinase skh1/pek1 [Bienertia sinuspersici]
MTQALICSNDWVRAKERTGIDMEENLRELEEVEKEFQGTSLGGDEDVVFVDSFI